MSGEARYSQPIEPQPRNVGEDGVVYAGFVNGRPGFVLRKRGQKEIRVEVSRANQANEKPRGFFFALAKLFRGSR